MPGFDIVIIGGGIVGASVAYHLAKKGITRLLLVEREPFLGARATAKCAGGIRQQFSSAVNIALSREAVRQWTTLAAELEIDFTFHRHGYLFLATTAATAEHFTASAAMQRSMGVPVEILTPGEVARRWPHLRVDDVILAAFGPADGYADPHAPVQGYAAGARRLGAQVRTGATVTGIDVVAGRVAAVRLGAERVEAGAVVNCAGASGAKIAALAGVAIPVSPYRRQLFTTTPFPDVPDQTPLTVDMGTGMYFRKECGGLMIGMTNPAEPPSENETVDADWQVTTIEKAVERVPIIERAEIQASWAGLYDVTPDHHPILGAAPGLRGYWQAVGFSGHGFMHSPAVGTVMAEMIADGRARAVDVSSLSMTRFARGECIRERNVI